MRCRVCSTEFSDDESLHDHYNSTHNNQYCKHCKLIFSSENRFLDHFCPNIPQISSPPAPSPARLIDDIENYEIDDESAATDFAQEVSS